MNAETLAIALGGKRVGNGWLAPCPAHHDRKPSFSIGVGDTTPVVFNCLAGCHKESVLAKLKAMGLWTHEANAKSRTSKFITKQSAFNIDTRSKDRTKFATEIWYESIPPDGTLVEAYLASRSLKLTDPTNLRFHPNLRHPSGTFWPAMVALIEDGVSRAPIGIHRTYLDPSGSGKAPVENPKMMLGECRGGAVKFGTYNGQVIVAEGIETALSVFQALQIPTWAALSCSGIQSLALPPEIKNVSIMADGDEPGEKAAMLAATRWQREGRKVRICRAPSGFDFNDLLNGLDKQGAHHGH
jgi:putative DNA primase/helicase